jgi:hypothetical protein
LSARRSSEITGVSSRNINRDRRVRETAAEPRWIKCKVCAGLRECLGQAHMAAGQAQIFLDRQQRMGMSVVGDKTGSRAAAAEG